MTRASEAHFLARDRAAFLRRMAESPLVGLWRWEEVDKTGAPIREGALIRFANGPSWVGDLEPDHFSVLRHSLGQMPARESLETSACPVKRRPRLTLTNAYLLLILGMLVGAFWMAFFDGEPELIFFVAVAVPVGLLWAAALRAMGSWRSRLELRDGRLRVFEDRDPAPTHDLARVELSDLWLREIYPTEQQAILHRGTAGTPTSRSAQSRHLVLRMKRDSTCKPSRLETAHCKSRGRWLFKIYQTTRKRFYD